MRGERVANIGFLKFIQISVVVLLEAVYHEPLAIEFYLLKNTVRADANKCSLILKINF